MYKVVRVERNDDTVFCDDRKFIDRKEAEAFFVEQTKNPNMADVILYYCHADGEDKELSCFRKSESSGKNITGSV